MTNSSRIVRLQQQVQDFIEGLPACLRWERVNNAEEQVIWIVRAPNQAREVHLRLLDCPDPTRPNLQFEVHDAFQDSASAGLKLWYNEREGWLGESPTQTLDECLSNRLGAAFKTYLTQQRVVLLVRTPPSSEMRALNFIVSKLSQV